MIGEEPVCDYRYLFSFSHLWERKCEEVVSARRSEEVEVPLYE